MTLCRRQRSAQPVSQPDAPSEPVGKILPEQAPPLPQPRPRQQPIVEIVSPVFDAGVEYEKNNVYDQPDFKPDVKKFQPYQRLDQATMEQAESHNDCQKNDDDYYY